MAKKLTEKQELLQFYKELMTDEHRTISKDNLVTYKIVRKDGTKYECSYQRPYKEKGEFFGWKEPTPESIVAQIMKASKPRSLTQRELNTSALAIQAQMIWIGEHRDLIPYLLEYVKTDREIFSCFREYIYWTELRQTNYTKSFAQWWKETFPEYRVEDPQKLEKVVELDRFAINSLPVAWLPKGYGQKYKSKTPITYLFSFLDDKGANDYVDKPKHIGLDDAIKSEQVFWMRVKRSNGCWPCNYHYTNYMITPIGGGMFEMQQIGKTKLGMPYSKDKIPEGILRTKYSHDWCSLQELHVTNTEFLL